ncbi:SRPBCC family protein [Nakamurella lactea]|uniref:SRPBCC family protein n=1 Tax=Nakamurella lactea TaxID=459515 RepID=UPI00040C8F60|nr:SRPBCC family protein [Nakamurella lactea]
MPQVTRTIEIAARPAAVWDWFSSAERLRRWLAPDLEIDVRVGGRYRMRAAEDAGWIVGAVLEMVPEQLLALSWMEEDAGWIHPARLTITLKPVPAGTEVSLTHDGFAGIGKSGWERIVQAYEHGVDAHDLLGKLASVAGRHG